MNSIKPKYWRYPARVLGCLRDGEITVILVAGEHSIIELPIYMILSDLRMPNSEFDVEFDRVKCCFTKVLRKGEISADTD